MMTTVSIASAFFIVGTSSSVRAMRKPDRKSTRLNSSHTEIYTLSLHDALPIYVLTIIHGAIDDDDRVHRERLLHRRHELLGPGDAKARSEEHTSELQSHRDLHSFPTRRSSDLCSHDNPRGNR